MPSKPPRATVTGKIISKRSRLPTDWIPNNADKEALLNWIHRRPDRAVLLAARDGDRGLLVSYLEAGMPVTPDIRKFLSEVLGGDRKRPNNRSPSASTVSREYEIAEFVSTVQRALKKHRNSLLLMGR